MNDIIIYYPNIFMSTNMTFSFYLLFLYIYKYTNKKTLELAMNIHLNAAYMIHSYVVLYYLTIKHNFFLCH